MFGWTVDWTVFSRQAGACSLKVSRDDTVRSSFSLVLSISEPFGTVIRLSGDV